MQSTAQFSLNHLQLYSHTLGYSFPLKFKPAVLPRAAAIMGKTQEIKCLGFTFPCLGTALLRISAKLKQPCFVGMECKTKARESTFKGLKNASASCLYWKPSTGSSA